MQEPALQYDINTSISPEKNRCSPLSIAYFTPGWPPEASSNGIITYVASMVEGIHEQGHQAHVLTGRLEESAELRSISQSVLQLPYRSTEGIASRLIDTIMRRIRPNRLSRGAFARAMVKGIDTVMAESRLDLLEMEESFGLADSLRNRLSIPVLVRLHGPWFLNGKAAGVAHSPDFLRRVKHEGQTIAQAFAITAPSRNVLEQTRQYYNLPLEKAVVIPCPIASTPKEQRWQPQTCEPHTIVFIGRFDRHKGGDLVIDAFAQVLKECPTAQLLFVGRDEGCVCDDGRVWQLEEYVRDRIPGALESGQVQCLGQQPPPRLRELRRRAQVTIIASRYDNFPYTALEALSLGCPIVGACTGGIPEIITDGVSGLLFQAGDAESLAAQTIRLLKNPSLAAQLGHQAGEQCDAQLSPEAVAKQSIDFYRETLARWLQSKKD